MNTEGSTNEDYKNNLLNEIIFNLVIFFIICKKLIFGPYMVLEKFYFETENFDHLFSPLFQKNKEYLSLFLSYSWKICQTKPHFSLNRY